MNSSVLGAPENPVAPPATAVKVATPACPDSVSRTNNILDGENIRPTRHLQIARQLLAGCPSAGKGVHNWLYQIARRLNPIYPDKVDLAAVIRAASASCGRTVEDREIQDAITNSQAHLSEARENLAPARPRWPKPNAACIAKITDGARGVDALREFSPVRFDEKESSRAEEVVDLLFPGNPLLCVGNTAERFDTRPRECWRGILERQQFIVPSPMSKITGIAKSGRVTKRSLDNTGPRRFLVVEFDPTKWENLGDQEKTRFGSPDAYYQAKREAQAALHLHLGRYAPLTMVLSSGGKSLQGWFYVQGQKEDRIRPFMAYAISLGADPATWVPSQFLRLPEGLRANNQKRQSVIYFNPRTIKA